MSQAGCFVIAESASIGLVDRLFTRVGASDDLARGHSTFMVEMSETAAILHNATRRSLVLLDEIGRGTSTYDGVAIAWSVAEYLHETLGCKTIFATHYHELTQLEDRFARIVNMNVAVHESGEEIVFLHRLKPGGADRSYGIHVARLAGLPPDVIARARQVLQTLEQGHHTLARPEARDQLVRHAGPRLGRGGGRDHAAVRAGPPGWTRRRDGVLPARDFPPPRGAGPRPRRDIHHAGPSMSERA